LTQSLVLVSRFFAGPYSMVWLCSITLASLVLASSAQSKLASTCCACSRGTDMGSDLVSFTGADGQSCASCCTQAPGLLEKHYESGKDEPSETCSTHGHATIDCRPYNAAAVDEGRCCACSRGTDMGSDLVSFTSADGHSCSACCTQAKSLLPQHYAIGKDEPMDTCRTHSATSVDCSSIVTAAVAAAAANKTSTTPSECCPTEKDCDDECCEAQAGPWSDCVTRCTNPPREHPAWAKCVKAKPCSMECCQQQKGSFEECMNQKCCGLFKQDVLILA